MPKNLKDRTCNTCKKVFKYPFRLDIHLQNKNGCKPKAILNEAQADITEDDIARNQANLREFDNRINTDFPDDDEQNPQPQQFQERIDINKYFKNIAHSEGIVCDRCNKSFKYKQNLVRHIKLNRCNLDEIDYKLIEKQFDNVKDMIDKMHAEQDPYVKKTMADAINLYFAKKNIVVPNTLPINTIQQQQQQSQQPIQQQLQTNTLPQQLQVPIPQINGNNNVVIPAPITQTSNTAPAVVINNITNNITNNNQKYICNNIQMINPFTKEDISFLQQCDISELMKMEITDAIVDLVDKVYTRDENQNFYKPNKSFSDISFLNDQCKFSVCHEKQFLKKLYLNGLDLYLRVMYKYDELKHKKKEIIQAELLGIIKNYKELRKNNGESMQAGVSENSIELYNKMKNFCSSMIENDNVTTRNNTMRLRKAYLIDKQVFEFFQSLCDNYETEVTKLTDAMTSTYKTEDIDSELGPMPNIDPTDAETAMILITQKFKDTPYKKQIDDRRKLEVEYFKKHQGFGNLFMLDDRLAMLDEMEARLKQFSEGNRVN